MGGQVSGQRRQFIQDLITRLKNSPGPQSSSPSWSSDRKFEVIAPGHLPLQNHKIQDEFEGELLESKYVPDLPSSRIQENSDNRDNRRKTLPGQYSRNVLRNSDNPYFQTYETFNWNRDAEPQSGSSYYQQDPEMWDRWDTWPSSFSENRRSKRSPYKNIKIKIGNPFADSPFYYNGKKPRRRVRVKQVLAARPAHTRSRYGYRHVSSNRVDSEQRYYDNYDNYDNYEDGESEHEGLWDDKKFDDLQYNDDRLVTLNEPENLPETDDYETHLSNEARELLGSGNFIIEKGGTFYDDEMRGYSELHPYRANNFNNNFRDFADIKHQRLQQIYNNQGNYY